MKIVIPSHKRAEDVITNKMVNGSIICVAKDQLEAYKYHNPNTEVVAHPTELIGISKKRNWILNHFGDVFMLDDDIKRMRRCYLPDKEKRPHPDAQMVTDILHDTYNIVKEANIKLWGFSKTSRTLHYSEFKPIHTNGFIQGCAIGVMDEELLKFPDDNTMTGEDEFIALLNAHYNRKMYIDKRFYFEFKTNNTNIGGCEDIRNVKSAEKSFKYLKKCFGTCIKQEPAPENYGSDFDYDIRIKWRLKIPF